MFRKKTNALSSVDETASPKDWAHGFFYLIPQAALHFGQDRREPASWRPGVSLARRDTVTLILPSTRKANPEFFHLRPNDVFAKQSRPETASDSYLCPRYEAVAHDGLIEVGVLRHGVRIDIAVWLQRRRGGGHD